MSFAEMNEENWYDAWTLQRDRAEAAEARVRELEQVPRNMRLVTESELAVLAKRAEAAEARVRELEDEISSLRDRLINSNNRGHLLKDELAAAEARVRELEDTTMSVECLDAVRRDVEAKTIERLRAEWLKAELAAKG